jgi:adenine/guanine phosphoribosyltransferase-like PRPP-binding protein
MEKITMRMQTDYLSSVFADYPNKLNLIIRQTVRELKKIEFDVIVVRGVSGLLLGVTLSKRLKKGLVVVRKPNEGTHSTFICEGTMPTRGNKWIIVDDILVTGNTLRAIFRALAYCIDGFVGVYLYNDDAKNWRPVNTLRGRCYILYKELKKNIRGKSRYNV